MFVLPKKKPQKSSTDIRLTHYIVGDQLRKLDNMDHSIETIDNIRMYLFVLDIISDYK